MKRAFFAALLISGAVFAQDTTRVLFVGNSYTNNNNLPQMIDDIANSVGDDLIYDAHTPGGNTMQQHSVNSTLMNKLDDDEWNFVVLQGQSQEPSFSPTQVASDVYPYAANLCDSILANNSCAEPLFFMTWGRKNGDASNCPFYPPICTYDGMQTRLAESYTEMSLDNEASLSPVGEVWREVRNQYPSYSLYISDESHPTKLGSYLAACTFYEIIWQKSSIGASYPTGVTAQEANNIQTIVDSMISQDLSTWLGYGDVPYASPSYELTNDDQVLLLANSGNTTEFQWEISDGTFLDGDSAEHTFSTTGVYVVYLYYSNDCHSYETSMLIQPAIGLEEKLKELNIFIENKQLTIQSADDFQSDINIFNIEGKKVKNILSYEVNTTINLQDLSNGIYILKLNKYSGIQFSLR